MVVKDLKRDDGLALAFEFRVRSVYYEIDEGPDGKERGHSP